MKNLNFFYLHGLAIRAAKAGIAAGLLATSMALTAWVSVSAQEPAVTKKSGQSVFEYVNKTAPDKRYAAPADTDPRDITLETMRTRLLAIEERVEKLERILKAGPPQ